MQIFLTILTAVLLVLMIVSFYSFKTYERPEEGSSWVSHQPWGEKNLSDRPLPQALTSHGKKGVEILGDRTKRLSSLPPGEMTLTEGIPPQSLPSEDHPHPESSDPPTALQERRRIVARPREEEDEDGEGSNIGAENLASEEEEEKRIQKAETQTTASSVSCDTGTSPAFEDAGVQVSPSVTCQGMETEIEAVEQGVDSDSTPQPYSRGIQAGGKNQTEEQGLPTPLRLLPSSVSVQTAPDREDAATQTDQGVKVFSSSSENDEASESCLLPRRYASSSSGSEEECDEDILSERSEESRKYRYSFIRLFMPEREEQEQPLPQRPLRSVRKGSLPLEEQPVIGTPRSSLSSLREEE